MAGWHHQCNGHELGPTLGIGEGQGGHRVAKSWTRLADWTTTMDCSSTGFSVHGISPVRILEWIAISSSRESSQPRDQTRISCVSCIAGGFFTHGATGEAKTEPVLNLWMIRKCWQKLINSLSKKKWKILLNSTWGLKSRRQTFGKLWGLFHLLEVKAQLYKFWDRDHMSNDV